MDMTHKCQIFNKNTQSFILQNNRNKGTETGNKPWQV